MNGPIEIGVVELAAAASLLLLHGALSVVLGLGLERKLLVAGLRSVVQLSILGFVLVPVFSMGSPWLVGGIVLFMVALAARESLHRSSRTIKGLYGTAFLAMSIGALATALLATVVILDVEPWWEPRYLIPLVGMILGNALTGVSLGLDRALASFDEQRDRVEAALSFGATRWEAARPVISSSVRTGLIPILNAMSAVGLVTIPGMMTGQILGGTDPVQASRYQMLILFLIAASTAMGVGIAVFGAARMAFDGQHRLRPERIQRR